MKPIALGLGGNARVLTRPLEVVRISAGDSIYRRQTICQMPLGQTMVHLVQRPYQVTAAFDG
jgi:hypothetical protein